MIKQEFSIDKCDFCDDKPTVLLFGVKDNFLATKIRIKWVCDFHRNELIKAKDLKKRWSQWI